jgi:hypothetical protein
LASYFRIADHSAVSGKGCLCATLVKIVSFLRGSVDATSGAAQYLVPTTRKSRISHLLSWPIGAEKLSLALASVPQLRLLSLEFVQDWYDRMHFPRYPVLSTVYLHNEVPFKSVTGESVSTEWLVRVHPVGRQFRHRIQEHILAEELPVAAKWFRERATLCLLGMDRLVFFYEEETDTFSAERETRLQPSTAR